MVEAAGEFALNEIANRANVVYNTGQVSENMKKSEFIVTPKKNGAVD